MSGNAGSGRTYCPACGRPNSPTASFCQACGSPLAPNAPGAVHGLPWSRGSGTGPARDARDGLSAGAIIVIVVLAMVAVTAVSAAIIYSTLSGLTPSTDGMIDASMQVTSTGGPSSSPASYYIQLSLAPSSPLSPNEFALKVTNSSSSFAVIAASPACAGGAQATAANCTASASGWYAVLVSSAGSVVATYSLAEEVPTWTNAIAGAVAEPVATGDSLLIVSHVALSSAGYTLTAFGTAEWGVVGSVSL